MFLSKIFLLFGTLYSLWSVADSSEDTLVLLHVVFRHGNRTPDAAAYPNDPYINETYYPVGTGELTNEGKRTEYKLGLQLRKKYDNFLGDTYTPDVLSAISSGINRTTMSLQLVLAALYPPTGDQIWNVELPLWQPIPFTTNTSLLLPLSCPNYEVYLAELAATEELIERNEKYKDTLDYIAENAGRNFTASSMYQIYCTLKAEEEWGFELPEWTKQIYPEPTYELASLSIRDFGGTVNLKRLCAGQVVQKIVSDSESKIEGNLENMKIFLYSSHDFTVGALLKLLDIFDLQFPPYGSYVTFELHNINDTYAFRVLYQNYTNDEPYEMNLPGCGIYCPVDDFVTLYEEYFPEGDVCG